MVYIFIGVLAVLVLSWLYLRRYKNSDIHTINLFIGGLGSGKTLSAVNLSYKLYKKNLRRWKRESKRESKDVAPLLFSNIPIFKNGKKLSIDLTRDILLGKTHIPFGSVLLVDEVGTFASQYDYKNEYVKNDFTEYIRLFRQITKGGYVVLTEQTIDSVVKPIRDRVNCIYYCLTTNSICKVYCTVYTKLNFTLYQDSYRKEDLEKSVKRKYGIFNMIKYDTFAYSDLIKQDKPLVINDYPYKKVAKKIDLTKEE